MSRIITSDSDDLNRFNFWMPLEKAKIERDEQGRRKMVLKGIASTDEMDLDKEILENKGFITDYLMERGHINWHHQAKNNPSAIIGEPIKAKVTHKGLFIKGQLYDTKMGRSAYETAKMLQEQSSTRRLGWSIEGKVLDKEGNRIKKALLTGVALTYAPKNASTFAEVVKSFQDEKTAKKLIKKSQEMYKDFNEPDSELVMKFKSGTLFISDDKIQFVHKALEAGSGRGFEGGNPLKKESLESRSKVTNYNLLSRILNKYPSVSFKKALKMHDYLLQSN